MPMHLALGLSLAGGLGGGLAPAGYSILRFKNADGDYQTLLYRDANGNPRPLFYKVA